MKTHECYECRNGEVTGSDGTETLCVVINPDGGMPKRGYICAEHIEMLLGDGYIVKVLGRKA